MSRDHLSSPSDHQRSGDALRLLHLEDNDVDATLLKLRVEAEWPAGFVDRVATEADFSAALEQADYDIIVSDFSLGDYTGMEALSLVRERAPTIPFLFLSGTIGEEHAVQALHLGAADYIIKDRPARLIPAIHAAMERTRDARLRRAAEQRLREQAELLDKARDAICVTDLQGSLTYWNHSASELFGWGDTDAPLRRLPDLFGKSNRAAVSQALIDLPSTSAWTKELAIIQPNGGVRHIISHWTLVKDDHQRPKSILLINSDLTQQKKLETQLLRSQRLESIGTLAGGIAHDLNNVLAPILMAVHILREEIRDEATLRMVDILETSVQHGSGLIRQVLAFARGAEGERTELQVALVIREVMTLLKETLPRAIEIETKYEPDMWTMLGNATQVSQVLMNLGVNARDAIGGNGTLRITAANCVVEPAQAVANQGAQAGPHIRVTVSDTGCGIPPEVIDRIFDPFFTTKAAGKGTGLGLSTVLGIVRSHGGFLEVQSEVGHGTEFRIYFPATQPSAPLTVSPRPRPKLRGRGETLLLIEDDPGVRAVINLVLTGCGFRILSAENGTVGLDLYRRHQQDIAAVLTDLMMPGIQGSEVIRELRALDPEVSIVAMSGVLVTGAEMPEEPGRLTFMAKPMSADDIISALIRLGVGS